MYNCDLHTHTLTHTRVNDPMTKKTISKSQFELQTLKIAPVKIRASHDVMHRFLPLSELSLQSVNKRTDSTPSRNVTHDTFNI